MTVTEADAAADVTTIADVTMVSLAIASEAVIAAVLSGSSFFCSYAAETTDGAADARADAETMTAAGSLLSCCFCAATDSETAAADSCK